jgi:anti-sigma regulatory factor (Ser/Thr protein kinase)
MDGHVTATVDAAVVSAVAVSRLDLVSLPSAPARARRHTKATLTGWQAGELIDTAELLVSELVTNAIRFSRRGPGGQARPREVPDITVTLRLLNAELIIEVADPDPNPPVLASDVADDAESGRGLLITEALSREWSYHLSPDGGKVVYCVIDRSQTAAHASH